MIEIQLEMCHVLQIEDIYTDTNQVHLRVYEPITTLEQENRPVFVYFHGGGFSLLSIGKTSDSYHHSHII